MRVVVGQNGNPPAITTPARMNAKQGADALAALLAPHDFADLCVLTIDFEGDGFTPVLRIDTFKWFPQYGGRRLELYWQLSLEDAFGLDNFDNNVARTIVNMLQVEFEEKAAQGPPITH